MPRVKRAAPASIEEYLETLPGARREAVAALRKLIVKNLPRGYEESFNHGMITYCVPLSAYPDTYNGEPLGYLALASQKNHLALYTMCVYMDRQKERWFRESFRKAGKKLDMGKSCVRFRNLDDLPLDVIGELVSGTPVREYIAMYEKIKKKKK